jgi:hypothetical protein
MKPDMVTAPEVGVEFNEGIFPEHGLQGMIHQVSGHQGMESFIPVMQKGFRAGHV